MFTPSFPEFAKSNFNGSEKGQAGYPGDLTTESRSWNLNMDSLKMDGLEKV